jgi:16S rRNA (guanine(966)-N(2))-methyltransferase RsmD
MRVVAGAYGGRTLRAPRGSTTRPTSDRVREALFSVLGPLDGLTVLDLFAGSGALGIEALSRGAAAATFVDSSPAAVAAIRANLVSLGLGAEVRRQDARAYLRAAGGSTFGLVFADPPYRALAKLAGELGELLPPLLAPAARVVVESDRREPAVLELPLLTERRYGDTVIRVHSAVP